MRTDDALARHDKYSITHIHILYKTQYKDASNELRSVRGLWPHSKNNSLYRNIEICSRIFSSSLVTDIKNVIVPMNKVPAKNVPNALG